MTMSHGNAFPGKAAVVPRSFMAICAYDGQLANVGRVVTDATWHHFVNINIKPGFATLNANDLADIKQYYSNLAIWLMPKNVRLCRRFPWIIRELWRYPLFEELRPIPLLKLTGLELRDIGALVEDSLVRRHTRAEVTQLLEDLLEDALGPDGKLKSKPSVASSVEYRQRTRLGGTGRGNHRDGGARRRAQGTEGS